MNDYREIIYFPIRGRIEPARLLMEDLQLDYLDTRIGYDRWPVVKRSMPFRELPMYKDDHCTIVQSQAIFHYLAKQHNLYGKSEQDWVHCHALMEAIKDANEEMGQLFWDDHFNDKKSIYIEERLYARLSRLQDYAKTIHSAGNFWVASANTIVDYVGWCFLDYVRALDGGIIAQFPLLMSLKGEFEQRVNIKNYLTSSRRPETITIELAQYGGTPETS